MQTVIAQFEGISQAQAAIHDLLERKYDKSDISYVAADVASGEARVNEASAGSAGSAVLGLLVGLGTLAIPYVGPVLAAGPMAVGLAGTSAGAAQEDWLAGPLGEVGVSQTDARVYGEAIRRGGALVLVRAREAVTDNISAILQDSGAVSVTTRDRGES